ncbi:sulfate transporter 2.2 isoform X1 [Arabidopsis lyrata subsp. lyrata]|uniref:sulfate transporter 2.2 isoform X1 n=1 Tax=Arabidopsis lyrata subsp. lyrata TaxID=81972 RepID=UPI000A29D3AF|nr:sulfate transporter 2.2 isoform X1 [Arabidopsis lyrata subsp. lyrata]|eukprot:XP_020891026.1 sulfate transporter 2.2 isoform X1 [Arabidopsis lyrata subsp. lyrata]
MGIELQNHQSHHEEAGPTEEPISRWLINTPEPPSMWQELAGYIRTNVLAKKKHRRNNTKNSSSNPVYSCLKSVFPILSWGRQYKLNFFKKDLMAGLTLASLCIPQSIGYANLAGLDPEYGLYTSVVPPLIYSTMGTSRELAIGPVAVVSLLLSSMVRDIQDPVTDPIAYRKIVFTVTFFAGAFQAIFGLFRLGFLVDFLSHAALVGFMAGAAIVIGLQQLKGLFGLSHFTNKTDVVSVVSSVFHSLHHPWQPLNFVIGSAFLIFILLARFIGKRNKKLFWIPAMAPLISVVLATLIVYLTNAETRGVKIVKHIKPGFNQLSVNQLQFKSPHLGQIAKIGLISAIIALTEAIAVGRSFATIKGYRLDGNKEMMAMGFMNIAGSLSSCYVATGSFSRTAVNFSAGCETVVSNIVMAITVMISLEVLTRFLYFTPTAILASIILSALPGLIDVSSALHIWKLDKLDFLVLIAAFFGVLFASVEIGLLLAVGISFARIMLSSIRPNIEALGRLSKTDIFGDINQYPMANKTPGLLTLRISSPLLCFANANFIRDRILNSVREVEEEENEQEVTKENGLQVVILDMSYVMGVDTSGVVALEELHQELASNDIRLVVASPRWRVLHKWKRAKLDEKLKSENIYMTVGEAVDVYVRARSTSHDLC